MVKEKEEKSVKQSYESDGIMGKETKDSNEDKEIEFFNITPGSE